MNFVAGLRQEAEIRTNEGHDTARLEELAYYIESLEYTIRQIEIVIATSTNPVQSERVMTPIKLQKKRMNEWMYGTWSPGPNGKREMSGILDISDKETIGY